MNKFSGGLLEKRQHLRTDKDKRMWTNAKKSALVKHWHIGLSHFHNVTFGIALIQF